MLHQYYILQDGKMSSVAGAESMFDLAHGKYNHFSITEECEYEPNIHRPLQAGDIIICPESKVMARLVTSTIDGVLLPVQCGEWQ